MDLRQRAPAHRRYIESLFRFRWPLALLLWIPFWFTFSKFLPRLKQSICESFLQTQLLWQNKEQFANISTDVYFALIPIGVYLIARLFSKAWLYPFFFLISAASLFFSYAFIPLQIDILLYSLLGVLLGLALWSLLFKALWAGALSAGGFTLLLLLSIESNFAHTTLASGYTYYPLYTNLYLALCLAEILSFAQFLGKGSNGKNSLIVGYFQKHFKGIILSSVAVVVSVVCTRSFGAALSIFLPFTIILPIVFSFFLLPLHFALLPTKK